MRVRRIIIAAGSLAALAIAAAPVAASADSGNGSAAWLNSGVSSGCYMGGLDNPLPDCTYTNSAGNNPPKWGHTAEVYGVSVGDLKG